ncbi:hypothetical protein PanWU01x14_112730 [Parasponia andersonii]|uniref:Uncharacterized protein n=1 Tax=Parasponia andersonii TaxID=3476 RepID=A0A2P5CYD9_PARAD|nr:hypothetical protein PanWU01x14_112730 [Parasponia andersonii]
MRAKAPIGRYLVMLSEDKIGVQGTGDHVIDSDDELEGLFISKDDVDTTSPSQATTEVIEAVVAAESSIIGDIPTVAVEASITDDTPPSLTSIPPTLRVSIGTTEVSMVKRKWVFVIGEEESHSINAKCPLGKDPTVKFELETLSLKNVDLTTRCSIAQLAAARSFYSSHIEGLTRLLNAIVGVVKQSKIFFTMLKANFDLYQSLEDARAELASLAQAYAKLKNRSYRVIWLTWGSPSLPVIELLMRLKKQRRLRRKLSWRHTPCSAGSTNPIRAEVSGHEEQVVRCREIKDKVSEIGEHPF